ncbi:MAG: zinc metallopeptidase [Verrucomicrobiota bacterium]
MMIWDQYWWLMIPGLVLGIYAQIKLSSTYKKYLRIPNERGLTGAEAAREILDAAGLPGMPVVEIRGHLNDHYDPIKKALFLSTENYRGQSIAAIGVSAHEAGHALQHKAAYAFLQLRMWLVPATKFASSAVYFIFILSFIMHLAKLAVFAVAIFAVIALFQVITLPVEFDASRRAKEQLLQLGLVGAAESRGVSKVLNAAALTYVAGMVAALLELVHWMLIARNRN